MYSLDEELQRKSDSSTDGEGGEHSDKEGEDCVSKSDNKEERTVTDDASDSPSERETPQLTFQAISESSNLRKAIQVPYSTSNQCWL